ncbi:uncharacterized protein EV422DRAFT_569446 [Fimicolochytrium jonesii]|uniref:uncharacterized protein n=1 Tax=Fimicolochytrium jonesii TaxID=1396493 RepID=UPI0022FE0C9B|nr:uncharacterized protein EV422DRAFT_569446 [Fimicolochytrium jonesii]KAI8818779.1 hypothetical protein EV422DRAFT_569446 [Fimicolochytrium jonesii]
MPSPTTTSPLRSHSTAGKYPAPSTKISSPLRSNSTAGKLPARERLSTSRPSLNDLTHTPEKKPSKTPASFLKKVWRNSFKRLSHRTSLHDLNKLGQKGASETQLPLSQTRLRTSLSLSDLRSAPLLEGTELNLLVLDEEVTRRLSVISKSSSKHSEKVGEDVDKPVENEANQFVASVQSGSENAKEELQPVQKAESDHETSEAEMTMEELDELLSEAKEEAAAILDVKAASMEVKPTHTRSSSNDSIPPRRHSDSADPRTLQLVDDVRESFPSKSNPATHEGDSDRRQEGQNVEENEEWISSSSASDQEDIEIDDDTEPEESFYARAIRRASWGSIYTDADSVFSTVPPSLPEADAQSVKASPSKRQRKRFKRVGRVFSQAGADGLQSDAESGKKADDTASETSSEAKQSSDQARYDPRRSLYSNAGFLLRGRRDRTSTATSLETLLHRRSVAKRLTLTVMPEDIREETEEDDQSARSSYSSALYHDLTPINTFLPSSASSVGDFEGSESGAYSHLLGRRESDSSTHSAFTSRSRLGVLNLAADGAALPSPTSARSPSDDDRDIFGSLSRSLRESEENVSFAPSRRTTSASSISTLYETLLRDYTSERSADAAEGRHAEDAEFDRSMGNDAADQQHAHANAVAVAGMAKLDNLLGDIAAWYDDAADSQSVRSRRTSSQTYIDDTPTPAADSIDGNRESSSTTPPPLSRPPSPNEASSSAFPSTSVSPTRPSSSSSSSPARALGISQTPSPSRSRLSIYSFVEGDDSGGSGDEGIQTVDVAGVEVGNVFKVGEGDVLVEHEWTGVPTGNETEAGVKRYDIALPFDGAQGEVTRYLVTLHNTENAIVPYAWSEHPASITVTPTMGWMPPLGDTIVELRITPASTSTTLTLSTQTVPKFHLNITPTPPLAVHIPRTSTTSSSTSSPLRAPPTSPLPPLPTTPPLPFPDSPEQPMRTKSTKSTRSAKRLTVVGVQGAVGRERRKSRHGFWGLKGKAKKSKKVKDAGMERK